MEKVNSILAYIKQKPLNQLPDTSKDKVESASVKSLLVPGRRATTFLADYEDEHRCNQTNLAEGTPAGPVMPGIRLHAQRGARPAGD